MYHRPHKQFLYSSYRITTIFSDGQKSIAGNGSSFLLNVNGIPWIVTNRHVVEIDYKKETADYKDFKLTSLELTGRMPDDRIYTIPIVLPPKFYFHANYDNDVTLVMPITRDTVKDNFHWHFSIANLATKEDFKNIYPHDVVCFSGYPNTHDKLMGRPIVRSGRIASDPLYNYSWNKEDQGDCIAYEGFSSPGASGSPIFATHYGMPNFKDMREAKLIGVNARHIPENFGHSGISVFFKSTVIHEIIAQNELYKIKKT